MQVQEEVVVTLEVKALVMIMEEEQRQQEPLVMMEL